MAVKSRVLKPSLELEDPVPITKLLVLEKKKSLDLRTLHFKYFVSGPHFGFV